MKLKPDVKGLHLWAIELEGMAEETLNITTRVNDSSVAIRKAFRVAKAEYGNKRPRVYRLKYEGTIDA